ncbi:pilin [Undibacterium sp. TC4M20W]|uniref:pilin n=1 Tax=unclassified Undibacterium TaxID=2630295 RepID=UPI003BF2B181
MKKHSGFTLLEMMIVIGVIAILAAMAVPSYMFKVVREQLEVGIQFADIAKKPVAATWQTEKKFPTDNIAAGLPVADKIVSNLISSVEVQEGVVNITFGNNAHGVLKGKVLSLRPAVVEDAPIVPVAWVCATGTPPEKMTVKGIDKTTVPPANLPSYCRPKQESKK